MSQIQPNSVLIKSLDEMRKRSSTVSNVPPISFGQKFNTSLRTHPTEFHAGDVIVNLKAWPGLARGDLVQVTRVGTNASPGQGFMFLVDETSIAGPKSSVQSISMLKEVANKLSFSQNANVTLIKTDPSTVSASLFEVYFRDMYLGRRDMWAYQSYLTGRTIYTGQRTSFPTFQGAVIESIFINGRPVSSAVVTQKTRAVFRSLSARCNIFISVCRELWDFAEDGERYVEKIIHSFFPTLISKWRELAVKHVVAIVLFSRVFYDQAELDFARGPLRQDEDGNWYKDFYKVVVDLEILKDWRPTLVNLKQSFLDFQRDILFNHHFHQNSAANFSSESGSLQRLVGRLSYAHESPLLETINLGLNPTDLHFIDRSLALTGCSTIIISPGAGRFVVDKNLLQFTTMRLIDQGFSVNLVCLTKSPLHVSPVLAFWSEDPDLKTHHGHFPAYGSLEMEPLWSEDGPSRTGEKRMYFWEPFWLYISWWDLQADMPFRTDRFVPRAQMHEIQTLGLLDHDVTSSISISYRDDPAAKNDSGSLSPSEARMLARDLFDHDVFAKIETRDETIPIVRDELVVQVVPPPVPPPVQSLAASRNIADPLRPKHSRRVSEAVVLDEKTTSINPLEHEAPIKPIASMTEDRTRPRSINTDVSPQRRSNSRESVRSTASVASSNAPTPSIRRKSTLPSRFAPAWLSFLRNPSGSGSTAPPNAQGDIIDEKVEQTIRSDSHDIPSSPLEPSATPSILTSSTADFAKQAPLAEPIAIPGPLNSERPPPVQHNEWPSSVPRPRVLGPSAYRVLNPSEPITLSRTNSVLARQWQHVFPAPTFINDIKWISMCAPACLPLTTEYFAPEAEVQRDYGDFTFDVYLTKHAPNSFLLRANPQRPKQDWASLALREMIAVRLVQGFQLVVRTADNQESYQSTEDDLTKMRPAAFPVGVTDVLTVTSHPIYLSLGVHIHRLLYEPIEDVIRVSRFVRRDARRNLSSISYECLVWPKLGEGYKAAATSFTLADLDAFGWNRLDRTIAGYQRTFGDIVRYWRTRYLVIPSEEPPLAMYVESGQREQLTDEETRLVGINRLADLFEKARWLAPNETTDSYSAPLFLPTTLDPPASVLDENLMARLDELSATTATGRARVGDKELEGLSIQEVASAMRDDDQLIQDNRWHGDFHPDSFTGAQWVSWALRIFRDVSTRKEAENWGAQLRRDGLFVHIRKEHGFMDGHYYYQLTPEYAVPKSANSANPSARWYKQTKRLSSKELNGASESSTSLLSSASPSAPLRPKKTHALSHTMIIDADHRKRSTDRAESIILHHDVIQNPGTAFHFEFNWIGTSGRCIDDLLKHWATAIEHYGLKLVEGYVDPCIDIAAKNIFQSCFPIPLARPPPALPDIRDRLPPGSSYHNYVEYAILRRFGYILDVEAEDSYSDTVDVEYSYRHASYKQSQFIHQSGRAFVQVMALGEGFRWVTNRLLAASTAFPAGGPDAKNEITPHEKAGALRLQLLEFCSSAERLDAFYEELLADLPPVRFLIPGSDDDEN